MSELQLDKIRKQADLGSLEAQFLLSQIYRQQNDAVEMLNWLQKASTGGLAAAQEALGYCYEKGQGLRKDYTKAMHLYELAIRQKSALASYRKAELLYKSKDSLVHSEPIKILLAFAANGGIVPAIRFIAYAATQSESPERLGLSLGLVCLYKAAYLGDPCSRFNLGYRLLQSKKIDCQREGKYWLQLAAKAQYPHSRQLLDSLNDIQATEPKTQEIQNIQFPESFSLHPEVAKGVTQLLNESLNLKVYEETLNLSDCAYLIYLSRPLMRRADVIDPDGSTKGQISSVRTNSSTYIPFERVDMISRFIENKILMATQTPLEYTEPMSVLHYVNGEQYQAHVDYFNPKLNTSEELLKDGGQRIASAITYLSAPLRGGNTSFPKLNVTVPATTGSTLWFKNCLENGSPDPRSLHSGDPVYSGEKWAVTKWIREKPTSYQEY